MSVLPDRIRLLEWSIFMKKTRHLCATILVGTLAFSIPRLHAQANASWVGDNSGNYFDGNWSASANWNPQVVPNGSYNVTIPWSSTNGQEFNGPELDIDVTLQNLTLVNRAVLDEQFFNGKNLTVNGTTSMITTPGHDGEFGVIWCWAGDYRLGTLTNYTPATKTLESGWINAFNGGTIRFHGGDIVTVKGIVGTSRGSHILNQDNGADALTNLAVIDGEFFFDGGNFSTIGNLTVNGFFDIGNSDDATTFTVTGSLTNFDPATHTLTNGAYGVHSDGGNGTGTAVFRFPNADIRTLMFASITLKGSGSSIQDLAGQNALRNLAGIQGTSLTSAGTLTINPSGGTFSVDSSTHTIDNGANITISGNHHTMNASTTHVGDVNNGSQAPANTTLSTTMAITGNSVIDGGGLDMGGQPGVNTQYHTQLQVMHGIQFRGAYLTGTGTTFADVGMIQGSVLDPGHSPGQLTFHGNLTLDNTTTTLIQLDGLSPGDEFDQILHSAGTLTLGGKLLVSFLDLYENVVSESDTFVIISSDSADGTLVGSFSNVASGKRMATNDGKGTFIVTYPDGNNVTLSDFLPPPPVTSVTKAPNDDLHFFVETYPEAENYDLQDSPDLDPNNWSTITTLASTGGGLDVQGSGSTDYTRRFYRLVYPGAPPPPAKIQKALSHAAKHRG